MNSLVQKIFPSIERDNIAPLLKCFFLFFFVLASWYVIRPVRNEFAVQVGAYDLSSLLGIVLVVMILLIPLYSWVVSRLSARNVLTAVYSFLILNLGAFILAWYYLDVKDVIAKVFYVWCNVYSFFVVSIFWVEMLSIFKSDEATDFILKCLPLVTTGEIFVPKMKSYKIKDLAKKYSKKYKIIGLRQGEKIKEELITQREKKSAVEKKDMWIITSYINKQ